MTEKNIKPPGERQLSLCPCKSRRTYESCCEPVHKDPTKAATAEQLMRARYSAYFFRLIDFLIASTHPNRREPGLRQHLEDNVHHVNWRFLTILATSKGGPNDKVGKVEFVAEYFVGDEARELSEVSRFKRHKGVWKYLDDRG